MNTSTVVRDLRNDCNVLRDDGISYGDYPRRGRNRLPRFTYPVFPKMAGEPRRRPYR